MNNNGEIDRRTFLKISAASLAALAGCGDNEQDNIEPYLNMDVTMNAIFAETNVTLEQFIVFAEQKQTVPDYIHNGGEQIAIQEAYDLYIKNRAKTIRSILPTVPNYKKIIDDIIDENIPKEDRKTTLDKVKDIVSALSSVEETKKEVIKAGLENAFSEFRELDPVRYLRQFGVSILKDIIEKGDSLSNADDKELVERYDHILTYLQPTIELLKALKDKETIQEKINRSTSDLTLKSLDEFTDAAIAMGDAAVSQGKNEITEEEEKFIKEVNIRFENSSQYLKQKIANFNIAYLGQPKRVFLEKGEGIAYAIASYKGKMIEKQKLIKTRSPYNIPPIVMKNKEFTKLEGMIAFVEGSEQYNSELSGIETSYLLRTINLKDWSNKEFKLEDKNSRRDIIKLPYIAWEFSTEDNERGIIVLDIRNGTKKRIKAGKSENLKLNFWSPTEYKLLFTKTTKGSSVEFIEVWNAETEKTEFSKSITNKVGVPLISPDGKKVAVSTNSKRRDDITIYDMSNGKVTNLNYAHQDTVGCRPWWSLDSEKILYLNKDGKVIFFDIKNPNNTKTTIPGKETHSQQWLQDDFIAFETSINDESKLVIFDTHEKAGPMYENSLGGEIVENEKAWYYVSKWSNEAYIIDKKTKKADVFSEDVDRLNSFNPLIMSPDRKRIIFTKRLNENRLLCMYDTDSKKTTIYVNVMNPEQVSFISDNHIVYRIPVPSNEIGILDLNTKNRKRYYASSGARSIDSLVGTTN